MTIEDMRARRDALRNAIARNRESTPFRYMAAYWLRREYHAYQRRIAELAVADGRAMAARERTIAEAQSAQKQTVREVMETGVVLCDKCGLPNYDNDALCYRCRPFVEPRPYSGRP